MGSVWSEKDPGGNNGEYPLIWMLNMFEFRGNSEFFLSGIYPLDIAEHESSMSSLILSSNTNLLRERLTRK